MAEQELAMQVLQQVVKLPVVKVDRSKFLVDKFSKELDPQDIPTLLEQGPTSLLSQEILDRVANACRGHLNQQEKADLKAFFRICSTFVLPTDTHLKGFE